MSLSGSCSHLLKSFLPAHFYRRSSCLFLNHRTKYELLDLPVCHYSLYPSLDLEEKLKEAEGARLKLIVTDGVFSMDGKVTPLK